MANNYRMNLPKGPSGPPTPPPNAGGQAGGTPKPQAQGQPGPPPPNFGPGGGSAGTSTRSIAGTGGGQDPNDPGGNPWDAGNMGQWKPQGAPSPGNAPPGPATPPPTGDDDFSLKDWVKENWDWLLGGGLAVWGIGEMMKDDGGSDSGGSGGGHGGGGKGGLGGGDLFDPDDPTTWYNTPPGEEGGGHDVYRVMPPGWNTNPQLPPPPPNPWTQWHGPPPDVNQDEIQRPYEPPEHDVQRVIPPLGGNKGSGLRP